MVPREALFARLDGAPGRTAAWIAGPPGAGKSTLAAAYVEARKLPSAWYQMDADDDDVASFFHYLAHAARRLGADKLPPFDPQYASNIGAYARKFFRQMFSAAASPLALVLDNLAELPAQAPLRAALETGLTQVPPRSCVIVTSRSDPPPALARMRAAGQMVYIGADELRLTAAELTGIAALRGQSLPPEAAARLQENTQGWAAAIVLMLEHAKIAGSMAELPDEAAPKVVFDYLAGEIFNRFEAQTQNILLRIACLKRTTLEVAQKLAANDNAGRLLMNLAHNDYFVREIVGDGGRIYQFHPLLRSFLLSRAATELPDAVTPAARRQAARLLREAGQAEDAVALLIEGGDWAPAAADIAELADTLLAQGRGDALAAWLELLPPELLAKNPRLLLADASSRMHASPRAARHGFEKACAEFRAAKDLEGMVRGCCGVIDSVVLEFDDLAALDRWRDELADLLAAPSSNAAAVATLVRAALLRDPRHPQLTEWLRLAARVADGSDVASAARIEIARAVAATLRGEFGMADAIAGDMAAEAVDPVIEVSRALGGALRRFLDGDFAGARMMVRDATALADAEGITAGNTWLHVLAAACAICAGDRDAAKYELQALEALNLRRGDRALCHYLRGALAMLERETAQAQREFRNAITLSGEAGVPWAEWFARVAMADALSASGDAQPALAQVRSAAALSEALDSPLLQVSTRLIEASVTLACGDETAALTALRTGLALGRSHGFRHIAGLRPGVVAALCAAALRHGVDTEFARNLIRAGRLAPPPSAVSLKAWPWPFRVTTLGGFALTRGDDPVEFSAKGAGRPVELLKVLVAHGGLSVRADQLADALWPNVDAGYAHKSFTQTLHRLRGYFDEEALVLRDGRLSLNRSLIWTDTWALELVLSELDAHLRNADMTSGAPAWAGLVEEILGLYSGPFLPDEAEQPIYIACRDQMRARVLRTLSRAARRWQETGRSEAAADCYLRCIEADELYEPFYRNLMLCHQRSGETTEALATYERLRTVLATRLKTMPAPETQAIYASLRAPAAGTG